MLYILQTIINNEKTINTEMLILERKLWKVLILFLHAWIHLQISSLPHTFLNMHMSTVINTEQTFTFMLM